MVQHPKDNVDTNYWLHDILQLVKQRNDELPQLSLANILLGDLRNAWN